MRTITRNYNIFTYDELDEKAQERAVNDMIEVWMECEHHVPEDALEAYHKAWASAERMQTPWFWGSYIWEYGKEQVLAECRTAYYLANGEWWGYMDEEDVNENKI